jgi:hypothetical protein
MLSGGIAALLLLVAATGCGSGASSGNSSSSPPGSATSTTATSQNTAAQAAARRIGARDRSRSDKLTHWFRTQKMTPSDLYMAGIDAPESMLKVYSIQQIRVSGSKVTIRTDLYPKRDNKDEFAGACNQVIDGYSASWAKHVEVIGQDSVEHGSWDDTDADGYDDSSGYMACQSDL